VTYPPGQPGSQWRGDRGDYPPPQQPYPPTAYPQAPYPPQPVSSYGIGVTAMILCTFASLCVVWSVIGLLVGDPFVVSYGFHLPAWSTVLNVVWSIGDILLIIGTIFMWCRNAPGRVLAAVGLSLVLAAVVTVEVVAVSMPADLLVRPWTWVIDIFAVLGLAFVLLPGTGEYLKAGRRTP
jgi:hypothetical protein